MIEESGFLLVDKPLEWTSFQVVNKLKYHFKYRLGRKVKIGHAGTLDPLATGLLIVCYGVKTKEISSFQDLEKTYTGTFRLGSTTPSFDLETKIDKEYPTNHINKAMIKSVVEEMTGTQMQEPPLFSAKKVDGKRAYFLARKGVQRSLKPKEINVSKFKISAITGNDVDFEIKCSKGTYIRSMANDFGKKLESGAHLIQLRRTAIGNFSVLDAKTLVEIESDFANLAKMQQL